MLQNGKPYINSIEFYSPIRNTLTNEVERSIST